MGFNEELIDELRSELKLFQGKSKAFGPFMRAKYHFLIRSVGIADHKAHIMVSINSLFLGGIFFAASVDGVSTGLRPYAIGVFLVCTLVSLTYSVLSVRPTSFSRFGKLDSTTGRMDMTVIRMGTQMPGNFFKAMDKTMQDNAMMYENVAVDFITTARIIRQKYARLRVAYNFFLAGLFLTSLILVAGFVRDNLL